MKEKCLTCGFVLLCNSRMEIVCDSEEYMGHIEYIEIIKGE